MVPKDLNAFFTFVHADKTAKSYKNSTTMIFPIQLNFHLNDKIADFLRN